MEKKIISLIAEKLGKKVDEIEPTSKIVEDLGADSLDVVEMIITLEDEFGLSLPDNEVKNMVTVADIVNYIVKNKN